MGKWMNVWAKGYICAWMDTHIGRRIHMLVDRYTCEKMDTVNKYVGRRILMCEAGYTCG